MTPKLGFVLKELPPTKQRLRYRVSPAPGFLMSLRAIGGQMEALGRFLKSLAKEDGNRDYEALLLRAQTFTDGSLEFEVMLAPKKTPAPTQPDLPKEPL